MWKVSGHAPPSGFLGGDWCVCVEEVERMDLLVTPHL